MIRNATEIRKDIDTKQQELKSFIESKSVDGGHDFDGDGIKALSDRNDELNGLGDELKSAEGIENAIHGATAAMAQNRETVNRREFSGGDSGNFNNNGGAASATKGVGDIFTESEALKSVDTMKGRPFETSFDVSSSAIKAATTTANALPYPTQQPFIVGFPTRRPMVADLIPQTDSDQPAIIYLEQTLQTFGAATVAEGAMKSESSFGWTRRTANFEMLAHWTKVTEQALEDIPQLRDRLNQEMTIGLQLAEEVQLLNGSGTTPDLQGFLTKAGVQVRPKGVDSIFAAFLNALTLVRFTGRANPTGAIFHPNDWEQLLTTQDTTGRFIFGDPSAIQQSSRLWGIPFIVTDAMPENTSLIGDFAMYSRLYRKGGYRVWFGTESDDVKRNLQTLRLEERAALTILRASAFVRLTGI